MREQLTQKAIDYVCDKTNRFKDNERTRAICEMRLGGVDFESIGREFGLSPSRCQEICSRVVRIYAYALRAGYTKPIVTNFDRLKEMTVDEMAAFLVKLGESHIITECDHYICVRCKRNHGGKCPVKLDSDPCLYDASDIQTVKYWLEGEVIEE